MCSSGGQITQTDEALQKAQAAMTNTLNADYSTTFAEQQTLLQQQQARLNYIAANPMGLSPAELHGQTTSINENAATAAKQAIGAAARYGAAHGAADVGGGSVGQIAGEIASATENERSGQLRNLASENAAVKRSNFWSAISGLNSVGSELGGAGGTAIGGANSAANSAVGAGSGALQAQQAGWEDFAGVLGGISGLVGAGAGVGKLFKPGSGTSG